MKISSEGFPHEKEHIAENQHGTHGKEKGIMREKLAANL